MNEEAHTYYETEYSQNASTAQRKWPNEELARFIGRTYGTVESQWRKRISILETGCGAGANIRLLIEEGFDSYGVDFSSSAIEYCQDTYPNASYAVADMTNLPYKDNIFDCIVDIFSSYCLNEEYYLVSI